MSETSLNILERIRTGYGKDIDLTLRPAYRDLLAALGNPQNKLPPVLHVAGTNGKGSTCAFMRAMLEAAGYRVHVYTSPHLVTFHERIRIAGRLIEEKQLVEILHEIENLSTPGSISYFEATTAAALVAFTRTQADFTILEVGLGGRLDATNIVDRPLATLITRLSYDHRDYLGDSIDGIAREKAGIMRAGVPCFAAAQPDASALQALRDAADKIGAPLSVAGQDWKIAEQKDGFRFADAARVFELPPPALLGAHQYQNAGLAIAALSVLKNPLPAPAIAEGLRNVEWLARLQRLTGGALNALLPPDTELWLDGGHNDSAGEVLAAQIARWRDQDGENPKPLYVILGMLTSKVPKEFLAPLAKSIAGLCAIPVEDPLSFDPAVLADQARALGISEVTDAQDVQRALGAVPSGSYRILMAGSLYLAGTALAAQAHSAPSANR